MSVISIRYTSSLRNSAVSRRNLSRVYLRDTTAASMSLYYTKKTTEVNSAYMATQNANVT